MKMIIYFFLICFPFFLYAKEYRPHLKDVSRGKWTLLWHDEFSNKQLFDSNWLVQNASPNHILSSRWSENVKIKGGKLFLENKKEYHIPNYRSSKFKSYEYTYNEYDKNFYAITTGIFMKGRLLKIDVSSTIEKEVKTAISYLLSIKEADPKKTAFLKKVDSYRKQA